MMNTPLISIITPAYKAEDTIIRAIQSVFAQDFTDWEMIIISDDHQNYAQILQDNNIVDKRLKFTSTDKIRSGSSNARNKGLEIAKGKYIASLDADDAFKPQKLSKMIPFVEEYGAAISNFEFKDNESNLPLEKVNKPFYRNFLFPKDVPWACLGSCSLYLYDRMKNPDLYYDNDFPRLQDFIFLMSLFNNIELMGFHNEPLHIYYKRQGSSSNATDTHELCHQSKKNVLKKINNDQISVKNDLAKDEIINFINFSLEIDDIYDQEIITNPNANWVEILKNQINVTQKYKFS